MNYDIYDAVLYIVSCVVYTCSLRIYAFTIVIKTSNATCWHTDRVSWRPRLTPLLSLSSHPSFTNCVLSVNLHLRDGRTDRLSIRPSLRLSLKRTDGRMNGRTKRRVGTRLFVRPSVRLLDGGLTLSSFSLYGDYLLCYIQLSLLCLSITAVCLVQRSQSLIQIMFIPFPHHLYPVLQKFSASRVATTVPCDDVCNN